MVFPSPEFVSDTIKQAGVHAPLGEIGLCFPASTVNAVNVNGLLPVILRNELIKAFPLAFFTVHKASIPVIPVCVLFVLGVVLLGVLTDVSHDCACQAVPNWIFRD